MPAVNPSEAALRGICDPLVFCIDSKQKLQLMLDKLSINFNVLKPLECLNVNTGLLSFVGFSDFIDNLTVILSIHI